MERLLMDHGRCNLFLQERDKLTVLFDQMDELFKLSENKH
jgi:hypothetical protein